MRAPALALLLAALGASRALAEPAPVRFVEVVVKPGDTLWGIANAYLKDPGRWNEILRYNRLPSSDPTLALPGMTLRVPKALVKDDVADVAQIVNSVLYRPQESPEWKAAKLQMRLYRDFGLRTLAASRARLRFLNGGLLSLDQNSMAILRPRGEEERDLRLLRGSILAARSRVVTPSADIVPKTRGTRYSARVNEDLSTRVEVYEGLAEVRGGGRAVELRGGFGTEVAVGSAPSAPVRLPRLTGSLGQAAPAEGSRGEAAASAGAATQEPADIATLHRELQALRVGVPVAAYHVQAARSPAFERLEFDRVLDVDDAWQLESSLPPGRYWLRAAAVDLLGVEGGFSAPRRYAVAQRRTAPAELPAIGVELLRPPPEGERVSAPKYAVRGRADPALEVRINGKAASRGAGGDFTVDLLLRAGENAISVSLVDGQGNERTVERSVTYEP